MKSFHRLLSRQIRKYFGEFFKPEPELEGFIHAVNESYQHYDDDRVMLERAMDLSSKELNDLLRRVKQDAINQKLIIDKLNKSIIALKAENEAQGSSDEDTSNLMSVVNMLHEQIELTRKADRNLKESESNLLALIENTSDAIWSIDAEHRLIKFNTIFESSFRFNSKLIPRVGMNFLEFVPRHEQDYWQQMLDQALKGINLSDQRSYNVHAKRHYYEISFNPIYVDEEIIGVSIFSKDITTKKIAEQELEQYRDHLEDLVVKRTEELQKSNEQLQMEIEKHKQTEESLKNAIKKAEESDKLKSAFLANMSHEIRTPMNAIVGFSGLLTEDDGFSREERDEFIHLIRNNSNSLLHLIDDIVDISKIEAGQVSINYSEISLHKLVSSIYSTFKKEKANAGRGHLELHLILPDETDLHIKTDDFRVRQVLNNLIGNAIKYTEDGYVKFGYNIVEKDNRKFLEFFVNDSGIGIDDESKAIIFDRFRKVEAKKNKLYRGAGLGLAISRSIVELLGGNIWVESEVNKGSTFKFTIPLIQVYGHFDEHAKIPEKLSFDFSNKKILVAEDEENNYKYLHSVLKRTNVSLIWAKNGKEAIEYTKIQQPNLVLMDLKMPELDGFGAMNAIKSHSQKIPIIALTAYAMTEERANCIKAGFDEYISKPVDRKLLLQKISEFIF